MNHVAHRVVLVLLPIALTGTSCALSQEGPERTDQQRKHRTVVVHGSRRAWLGVSTEDLTAKRAQELKLTSEHGAVVRDVVDESPAESAGIKEGDVIVSFNGKEIVDADGLVDAVRSTDPGTVVTITVIRKGEKATLNATLGRFPRIPEPPVVNLRVPHVPAVPQFRFWSGSAHAGMSLLALNHQLGEYFEAPDGEGVLVERVNRKSAAEKAGFKAGDVIIRIGKKSIADVGDVRRALDRYDGGEKAECEVLRKGKRITLSLEIEETNTPAHEGRFWRGEIEELEDPEVEFDQGFRDEMHDLESRLRSMHQDIRESTRDVRRDIRDRLIRAGVVND
jgi:membrane-associated protease RseP (regulator of RpoE activity)